MKRGTLRYGNAKRSQCIEGRHLKQHNHKNSHVKESIMKGVKHDRLYASEDVVTKTMAPTLQGKTLVGSKLPSTINANLGSQPPPPHGVEDFRPTAPGHSPGAGHSIQN
ncbi:putative encoded peptide [Tanacetum coccineum]